MALSTARKELQRRLRWELRRGSGPFAECSSMWFSTVLGGAHTTVRAGLARAPPSSASASAPPPRRLLPVALRGFDRAPFHGAARVVSPSLRPAIPGGAVGVPSRAPGVRGVVTEAAKGASTGSSADEDPAPSFPDSSQEGEVVQAPLRDLLADKGLVLPKYTEGQYRILCPQCEGGTKHEKSLAVAVQEGGKRATWTCFRGTCGWTGYSSVFEAPDGLNQRPQARSSGQKKGKGGKGGTGGADGNSHSGPQGVLYAKKTERPYVLPTPKFEEELGDKVLEFFAARRITEETLARNGVRREMAWSPVHKRKQNTMAFPYMRNGQLVNIKYRGPEKTFWQVKGAEKILFGLDDVRNTTSMIIVEGEMDKLALEEAGYRNVVSVPDGAPTQVKSGPVPEEEEDTKYQYLWNCREYLDSMTKIVIATDADAPGQALAEELSRRLGKERCWKVNWPQSAEDLPGMQYSMRSEEPATKPPGKDGAPAHFRKDANEVLVEDGPAVLAALIEAAEPYPIRGLFKFSDFMDEINTYYNLGTTLEVGVSTGWYSLDPLYRVVPGELTVVTGVPNSGKSEWIDALLTNLAVANGWSFALCSMENKVRDHARKLLEKYRGEPFFESPYNRASRMSPHSLQAGMSWLDKHFVLLRCDDDMLPSVDWVLDLARVAVLRYGIRGLVIDPYNELDHQRAPNITETEYVSQMLTKLKRFAQHHGCHVWFVAHPRSMGQWDGRPPGLYDISGSAHFINKCDNGVVVHRSRDPEEEHPDRVQVLIRKVRNKAAGTIGDCVLQYDRATGRYHDLPPSELMGQPPPPPPPQGIPVDQHGGRGSSFLDVDAFQGPTGGGQPAPAPAPSRPQGNNKLIPPPPQVFPPPPPMTGGSFNN